MLPGGGLPCIFVSKPERDPNTFSWVTFDRENDPEKGNKILVWKAEKGLKHCHPWTSLQDGESFILLLEQLTMNVIQMTTTKYSNTIILLK